MINRRKFLTNSLLVSGVPLIGMAETSKRQDPSKEPMWYGQHYVRPVANRSYYISHRGVHLKQSIAGENSIESLALAKRVGFECMEFDIRLTKDNKYVVIHDDTINRTLQRTDGKEIPRGTKVNTLTLREIREEYVIKTLNPVNQSRVPTLEEYLIACTTHKLIPFIEIKESHLTSKEYLAICDMVREVVGDGNFVITSNNEVNRVIRSAGDKDTLLMGILYQTTFDTILNWQNTIMAISTSRFTATEYVNLVRKAKGKAILTESHADSFDRFELMYRNGVEFFSTDLLAPNPATTGQIIYNYDLDTDQGEFTTDGIFQGGRLNLLPNQTLSLHLSTHKVFIFGSYIELKVKGNVVVKFGNQSFKIQSDGHRFTTYQLLLHKTDFELSIKAIDAATIDYLSLKIIKF